MPSRHHSARPREYGVVALHPHHGIVLEAAIEFLMFGASVMFVIGSVCFFSSMTEQVLQWGMVLFIIASGVYVGVAVLEAHEMWSAHSSNLAESSAFHEQIAYLVSAIIFTIGTVLYWPHIYNDNDTVALYGEAISRWCFMLGSLGFVIASFWNAVSLADVLHEDHATKLWHNLTKAALFFSIMGGVFFVTGSYLYFINIEDGCSQYWPVQGNSTVGCVSVTDHGTVLYVIGSLFYLTQSILNLIKLCMKQIPETAGYCVVYRESDSEDTLLGGGASD